MADQSVAFRMYSVIEPRFEWVQGEGFDTLLVYVSGFKKKELKVRVDNTSWNLKVTGERNLEGNKWFRFQKNFPLPKGCEISNIKTKIDKGILYVVMPKSPAFDQTPSQVIDKLLGGVVSTLRKQKLVILNVVVAVILLALVLFRMC